MQPIPETEWAPVLRTDFSNQAIWESIRVEILKPVGILRFRANVSFIDDSEYANISKDQIPGLIPPDYSHSFIVVVDQIAISLPDHPLLIVDLFELSGNTFRAIPSSIQGIENNLSIGNMDFEEFAQHADQNGVFRGFPRRWRKLNL